jgi:hypothetical protein
MNTSTAEFQRLTTFAVRRLARRQGSALMKYGQLSAKFGNGEIGLQGFGVELTRIAADEGAAFARDALLIDLAYWQWLVSAAGIDLFGGAILSAFAGRRVEIGDIEPARPPSPPAS